MSFLTPLYILGALAVAGPILFHLIRRSPRGEVPFSSLMFLAPTPPRLTRRSRIDQWLLLLLRAAVLGLLALAFARPFLRQASRMAFGEASRSRVAVLVDTSASLRRGNLWARSVEQVAEAVAACRPGDELAVFAFDDTTRPVLGFAESATLDPARRLDVARARLAALTPTWSATHLGQALVDAVAALDDVPEARGRSSTMTRRIVLVSDLQQGSRLDGLHDLEWPADVVLDLRTVSDPSANANLQWLADATEGEAAGASAPLRVRVFSDPGARRDAFELSWVDASGSILGTPIPVHVPPGESRVARLVSPTGDTIGKAGMLRLKGDAHPFDNTIFLAPERKDEATVLFVGKDAPDDPAGLLYYLARVFAETPSRSVRIVSRASTDPLTMEPGRPAALVVLAAGLVPGEIDRLRSYVREGGTVLAVLAAPEAAAATAALADVPPIQVEEARVGRDILLGTIAFDHPLFAEFAAAQFNDFTKIHFWKYRKIRSDALGDAKVVARFESGDPAIVEKSIGKGRLVVMTSGWNPADSQLARSSKFVPLMSTLLEGPGQPALDAKSYLVHERVRLSAAMQAAGTLVVHKPDGATATVAPGAASLAETDMPGVYTIDSTRGSWSFAVNLDPAEGKTAPLAVETLEQLGCRLASHTLAVAPTAEQLRQLQGVELESRQKLWRWLILVALGVLFVETWLAGRLSRPRAEALAS